MDRADGVRVGAVTVYQAIPSGLALNVDLGGGVLSIHLRPEGERGAAAEVRDPAGRPARFAVEAENRIDDRRGTGALSVRLEAEGRAIQLQPGMVFSFGGRAARLVSVGRWSGFTWSRSPGMPGIFLGFGLLLLGALLLVFPAGAARLAEPGEPFAARVSGRGTEAIAGRWAAAAGAAARMERGPGMR